MGSRGDLNGDHSSSGDLGALLLLLLLTVLLLLLMLLLAIEGVMDCLRTRLITSSLRTLKSSEHSVHRGREPGSPALQGAEQFWQYSVGGGGPSCRVSFDSAIVGAREGGGREGREGRESTRALVFIQLRQVRVYVGTGTRSAVSEVGARLEWVCYVR